MPSLHSSLCALYLVASLSTVMIVLHAMWSSFVNTGIAVFVDGVEQYAAAQAIVGLVGAPHSSQVFLCAVVTEESLVTTLGAKVQSFSGILKMDDKRLGLYEERSLVCLSFVDNAKLQDFVASLAMASAAAQEDVDETNPQGAAPDISESTVFVDPREGNDEEWDVV